MGILIWLVFGALIGWFAALLTTTQENSGVLSNIIIGMIGALAGGFLSQALGWGGVDGFNGNSFLVALVGSILLLAAVKVFNTN